MFSRVESVTESLPHFDVVVSAGVFGFRSVSLGLRSPLLKLQFTLQQLQTAACGPVVGLWRTIDAAGNKTDNPYDHGGGDDDDDYDDDDDDDHDER